MEFSTLRQDEGTFLEDLSGPYHRATDGWSTSFYGDEVQPSHDEGPSSLHEARPCPREIRPKVYEPQQLHQNRFPLIPAAEGMCPWKPPPKQEVPQPQGSLAAAKRWKWEMEAKRSKAKKPGSQSTSSSSAPRRAWACDLCPATFNSRQGRWEHRKKEHEGLRLDCPFDGCERTLKSRSGMDRHIKGHYKELDGQAA